MNTAASIPFLPNLGRALRHALQWRLLLWWVLLTAIPTLVVLTPLWQTLSSQLDHTIHATEWAQYWNVMALSDLVTVGTVEHTPLEGSVHASLEALLILIPLMNALFIAAARSASALHMGELLRQGLGQYWRMFRLMLVGLIPIALALWLLRLINKGVTHYGEAVILESDLDHVRWAALAGWAIVFAIASASVDAARASFALEPERRSAIKAWWRGLKLVLRHPLRSAVLYLGVTALAGVALAVVLGLRLQLRNASLIGWVLGLLIAQIITAIIGWMHYARLFGMLELTRALKPAPGS
jgi:hypothetical protein